MLTLDMMMAETLCGTYVEEDGPTEMALRKAQYPKAQYPFKVILEPLEASIFLSNINS